MKLGSWELVVSAVRKVPRHVVGEESCAGCGYIMEQIFYTEWQWTVALKRVERVVPLRGWLYRLGFPHRHRPHHGDGG